MRTTDFMDKPMMMGLSRSRSDDDFSVDFSRNSSSLNNNTSLMDHFDSTRVSRERVGASDSALISAIDRKVKEHVDNVLYAVEGISARLSQLETRTRHLESCVDDMKESVGYNHGRVDGKLRELENILREVQGGVLDLRDKQEIAEAQFQLAKLQASKKEKRSENQNNSMQTSMAPETSSFAHQQTQTPLPDPVTCPQVSALPNVFPPLPYQNPQPVPAPTAVQIPDQIPQNQIYSSQQPESYYPPPAPAPETMHQQYHSTQHLQPQPSALHQHHGPAPQFAPQLAPTSWVQHPSQLHPPMSTINQAYQPLTNHPEEIYHTPPQTYPPSVHKPSQPPRASQTQTQQPYVGSTQQIHDQASSGSYSEYPSAYSQRPEYSNFGNIYPYSGSPTSYRSPTMKSTQSTSASAGGNNHSRLPTAKLLPQALPTAQLLPQTLPTASSVDGGTGNRVPVDDVVDKVVAMGFRRDMVRATVRKMTENGQSVDLNAVLDKVMNDGGQPDGGR